MSNAGSRERSNDVVDRPRDQVAELRRSRKRLVQAEDADRRAIERALHDGLQQQLVALAIDLRRLDGLIDRDPAAARALSDELAITVRVALDQATDLAQLIHPPLLEAGGLPSALRSAAERAGVTALIDAGAGARYSPEISAAIYWSWVEAISSGSRGSQATISAHEAHGGLAFEITVAGHHPESRLDRLRDRIEALDGRVSVDDELDGSSRLQGWLPWSG